jgi:hypothetical protein
MRDGSYKLAHLRIKHNNKYENMWKKQRATLEVLRTSWNLTHTKRGNLCIVIPGPRMLKIVVIKLIEPKMDDTPDR